MGKYQAITLTLLVGAVFAIETDTNEVVIKNVNGTLPIIIQTQAQSYEQPTLDDYTKCHENLDTCLKVCESTANKEKCESECPTCPILINQDILVQGVNDTDYRAPAPVAVNTTHIVRLTNEIRNVLENNLGNITTRNENNIEVKQNITKTVNDPGKYGLGTNANGQSCCLVVRASSNCDTKQFSNVQRCHHKRHRVCSDRCKSHTMYAKRVTHCTKEDDGKEVCKHGLTYVTESDHGKPHSASTYNCRPMQAWPYVACQSHKQKLDRNHCGHCLAISYGYILQHGIPAKCRSCFQQQTPVQQYPQNWYGPQTGYYAPPMYPAPFNPYPYLPPGYNFETDYEDDVSMPSGEGWQVEKTKCRHADGTIDENCTKDASDKDDGYDNDGDDDDDDEDFYTDNEIDNEKEVDPLGKIPVAQEALTDHSVIDNNIDGVSAVRHRRHTFHRSLYSRRYKD